MKLSIPLLSTACLAIACGPVADVEFVTGTSSQALGAQGNQASCATCHSSDGSLGLSGVSFKDIAYKTSYKGGDAPTLLAATNACVTGWMGGTALKETDASYQAIKRHLETLSAKTATTPNELAPEVLADVAAYEAAYAGGNATQGMAAYTKSCGGCHESSLNLGGQPSLARSVLKTRSIGQIARKVRTSGPPPSGTGDQSDVTPGPMPFFEPEDVSVTDLKNIIAYIRS